MDSRDLVMDDDARVLYQTLELMERLSFETTLGISLKNSMTKLSSFDDNTLFADFEQIESRAFRVIENATVACDFRAKCMESIENKLLRSKVAAQAGLVRPIEKVLNDLIGLRVKVDSYDVIRKFAFGTDYRVVDMTEGKACDDGYRAVHIYYQPSHKHYPVELQLMTEFDGKFNAWLHEATYKIKGREDIGGTLRQLYERGVIADEEKFKETLNVLLNR